MSSLKMAKPSAKDIAAAEELQRVLIALDKIIRWHQSVSDLPQCIDDDVSQGYCVSYEKLEELENLIPQSAYDFDPEESPPHSQQRCSIGQPTSHDAELQVTIEHNGKCFGVDESISEFVTLLNSVGLETVASCSGHGHRPANIALKDGREIIIARDYEEARKIDRIFPVDINGDKLPFHQSQQNDCHDWDDQDKCKKCGDRDWYASPVCNGKSMPSADRCPSHESEHSAVCESVQAEPDRSGMYFYKNSDCAALHPQSPDCKCWYKYGTGPLSSMKCESEQGGAV